LAVRGGGYRTDLTNKSNCSAVAHGGGAVSAFASLIRFLIFFFLCWLFWWASSPVVLVDLLETCDITRVMSKLLCSYGGTTRQRRPALPAAAAGTADAGTRQARQRCPTKRCARRARAKPRCGTCRRSSETVETAPKLPPVVRQQPIVGGADPKRQLGHVSCCVG